MIPKALTVLLVVIPAKHLHAGKLLMVRYQMDSSASVRLVIWFGKFIDIIDYFWLKIALAKPHYHPHGNGV